MRRSRPAEKSPAPVLDFPAVLPEATTANLVAVLARVLVRQAIREPALDLDGTQSEPSCMLEAVGVTPTGTSVAVGEE
jgi:hypothetical protein